MLSYSGFPNTGILYVMEIIVSNVSTSGRVSQIQVLADPGTITKFYAITDGYSGRFACPIITHKAGLIGICAEPHDVSLARIYFGLSGTFKIASGNVNNEFFAGGTFTYNIYQIA